MGVLLAALTGGCEKTVEFHPYDAYAFRQRRVMMLEATALPPLPAEILLQTQERVERWLVEFPYLGKVITRTEVRDETAQDRITGSNYALLSDTATVLGITEREMTLAVLEWKPVDLFASVQVLRLPCPGCEQDDRVAVIAQIFDAKSAELRWRAHLSAPVDRNADRETVSSSAEALTEDLLRVLDHLLKPKWHRERFEHLRPHPAEPAPQS